LHLVEQARIAVEQATGLGLVAAGERAEQQVERRGDLFRTQRGERVREILPACAAASAKGVRSDPSSASRSAPCSTSSRRIAGERPRSTAWWRGVAPTQSCPRCVSDRPAAGAPASSSARIRRSSSR
jgi:hypothetical protein